jgi:uroporphyrinogen III methyltransferase / synthase
VLDVVEAYRTEIPAGAHDRAREVFGGTRRPDWITFTSSSTVTNFIQVAGREALSGVRIASIGPITSGTLRSLNLTVTAEAESYTIPGLIRAIQCYNR